MIEGVTPLGGARLELAKPSALKEDTSVNFKELLDQAISDVNDMQKSADTKIAQFSAGEVTDPHEVMIAIEEASLALQYTMQIRNKMLDAYQEIMRMQV